jgi:hypothetical protein
MHHRIGEVALARQRRIVARRPTRTAGRFQRDQPRGARGFDFGGSKQVSKTIEHE